MDEPEFQSLLQANNILRADGVGAPEYFIKIFAVPAPELCSAMIDVIERPHALDNSLDLPELADIAPGIGWNDAVCFQTVADLIWLVVKVARNDMMPARAQLLN